MTVVKIENALKKYVPEGTEKALAEAIVNNKVLLSIKAPRKSKLGDYRPHPNGVNHYITINSDLNKYSFLVTLLHELAHLFTHRTYGRTVQPHGAEWKSYFQQISQPYISKKIFPDDISLALNNYLLNPKASSCSDENLYKVLNKYNEFKDGLKYVDELSQGAHFIYNGKLFQNVEKLRKRFKCVEVGTGKMFVFYPTARVKSVILED